MTRSADFTIVGAGPAGARAGELLAARGARVLILDARAPWEKPCGGGLTPPTFDDVPELAEIEASARPFHRVRVELSPDEGVAVELERPIRILSRRDLGGWQLERALAAGAGHASARVRTISRAGGGWKLETDEGSLAARFLVGADGAASLVRRAASPSFRIELTPARVAYAPVVDGAADVLLLRFYDGVTGYLWDFPRPGHRSVGIEVAGGDWGRASLDREIDAYRASSEARPGSRVERAGAVIGSAQLGHGDFSAIGGSDFALLGDAAGFADPLTGEGIHNALRSAALLAEAWSSGDVGSYARRARRALSWEFTVARLARRSLMDSGLGVALVRSALTSDVAYGSVAAMVNALNEHAASPLRLARWAARTVVRVRRDPSMAARGPRAQRDPGGGRHSKNRTAA